MTSLIDTFTQHLNYSESELEALMAKPLHEFIQAPEVTEKLSSLNINLLRDTITTAGEILAQQLPPFYHWLKHELGVKRVPEGPEHTTKWVVGFLRNEESVHRLVELHRPVPRPALEAAVPRLVDMFAGVEDENVRLEWQKAIAILCLVLVVDTREQNISTLAS